MFHLRKIKSDHRSLAIRVSQNRHSKPPRLFRFLSGWLSHEGFAHLVTENWCSREHLEGSVLNFIFAAKRWNVEVFGNILKKKRILIA